MGQAVGLGQMLEAREKRAARQRELLERYRMPLVSFTMNIAGPIKNGPSIRRGFQLGKDMLLGQLDTIKAPVVWAEEIDEDTGCEGLYVVDLAPDALKELTSEIEERAALGRLFDMDVLAPDGTKLDRAVPRACLICGKPARECARNRTHSVVELQERTRLLLTEALDQYDAETAARLAVQALLYEVCTTPKPGLVDRVNSGSHRDMDLYTFMNSSAALWPYFAECVHVGRSTAERPATETLAALRFPGKMAESAMRQATGGVNTHKGAIFSLGLVCGALGRMDRGEWDKPEQVLAQASAMAKGVVERDLSSLTEETAETAGQRFYVRYGETGVRGQAEEGFPAVLEYGLPTLENGLTAGMSVDRAGAAALLALLAHTTDTNMIRRGGIKVQRRTAEELRTLLADTPYPDRAALETLDKTYIERNLSPGGSADLLALCYLLHFLKGET